MRDTSRSQIISTQIQAIAEQAIEYPEMVFTTLAHRIDVEWLREAYRQTNKSSAAGIDGITAAAYGANLAENLEKLHERLKSGQYKAPPVERVWLDKEDGRKRPIGKPTFEDKIVQRAVVMLLEPIYEQEFYDFSHGYRKGHSAHQALHELWEACRQLNINWIVDADVSWGDIEADREMAESGGDGGRKPHLRGERQPPRGRDQSLVGQHISALCSG
jgi:retron-type reverse transcriptase